MILILLILNIFSDAISLSLRVIQKRNIRVTLKADNLNAFSRVFGDNAELMFTLSHEGALKNWSTGSKFEIVLYNFFGVKSLKIGYRVL